jgi:solute carrier family 8 (sodium/calcium exchanger)
MSQVGLIFPIFIEQTWSHWLKIVLYFFALCYSFIAVFIVADIFMCSIDAITSKTKMITVSAEDGTQEQVEVPVWNGTAANIVLMSLGPRTAPEILLSIIGILFNDFQSDPLGNSLIIGSGAFNLIVISSISIFVIPSGETRRIKTYSVFVVTMFWSIFAYFWLFVILGISSKDRVEIWEASVTMAFIPVMILTSVMAEKGWFDWIGCCPPVQVVHHLCSADRVKLICFQDEEEDVQLELGGKQPEEHFEGKSI